MTHLTIIVCFIPQKSLFVVFSQTLFVKNCLFFEQNGKILNHKLHYYLLSKNDFSVLAPQSKQFLF